MRNVLTGILVLVGFQLFWYCVRLKCPNTRTIVAYFQQNIVFTWLSRFVGGNNDIVAFNHNG